MSKSNQGVINKKAANNAAHFDAPFSLEHINIDRVARYQDKYKQLRLNNFKSTLSILSMIVPFVFIILILVIATLGIIMNPEVSSLDPFKLFILLLDFFVLSFVIGVSMEFHEVMKKR